MILCLWKSSNLSPEEACQGQGQDGIIDVVETLIKAGGSDACMVRDDFGNTTLHIATYNGNTPAVKIRLECVGKKHFK